MRKTRDDWEPGVRGSEKGDRSSGVQHPTRSGQTEQEAGDDGRLAVVATGGDKGRRGSPDEDGPINGYLDKETHGNTERPEPEVIPRAKRRTFSVKYKLAILEQADALADTGKVGALLRREGLYYSNLASWRKQREDGTLDALRPKKRGPKPDPDKALLKRIARLEKEKTRLTDKLETAELIIQVQKKVSRLLEMKRDNEDEER